MASKNNYRNRRARGQCARCTKQSERFYCDECRERLNARMREWRFRRSMEREQRLEELDRQLAAEVRELLLATSR